LPGGSANQPTASTEDSVRAPILPTRGVLVEPTHAALARPIGARSRPTRTVQSVFSGGLRDFAAETREQEERISRGLPINGPSTSDGDYEYVSSLIWMFILQSQ
jgi:hypothetical protein